MFCWFCRSGVGCEFDVVSDLFELGNEVLSAPPGLVAFDRVVGAEFVVDGVVAEQMPGDHQDCVGDRDQGSLLVPVVASAWDAWRTEVDFAARFVAEAPNLDITGSDPLNQHGSGGGSMSLREVLVGMIEEYARHMGHVDLLRERIDGRLGQ